LSHILFVARRNKRCCKPHSDISATIAQAGGAKIKIGNRRNKPRQRRHCSQFKPAVQIR
jgi:hypothetical protein